MITEVSLAGGPDCPPGVSHSGRLILDEKAFTRTIALERKRSERSQKLFLLVLFDVRSMCASPAAGKMLEKVLSTLSRSTREIDVLGWRQHRQELGVIFTEIASETRNSVVSTILLRVKGLLYNALTFEEFNQITVSHHLFPDKWDHDVPQRPSHPILYPDLSIRENGGKAYRIGKRTMDLLGSCLGLLLLLPVFLAIAFLVKISSKGPVLFRQVRVGQYGAPFLFLKFRSMYSGNDPRIHREYVKGLINGKAEKAASGSRAVYKLTGDPRVTRIGTFLRKTSLDELPQLYNVLHGEMSLVGPRPAIPYEVEAYDLWHRRRVLEAKPGITGLWQVKGRSRVTFDDMVRLDVRYAMTRSLWLDLKILLCTPRAVLSAEGAC